MRRTGFTYTGKVRGLDNGERDTGGHNEGGASNHTGGNNQEQGRQSQGDRRHKDFKTRRHKTRHKLQILTTGQAPVSDKQSTLNPTTASEHEQEATPRLHCSSNGGSSDVLCYLRRMFSPCPAALMCWWADNQRCETLSAPGNLVTLKLRPSLCQPGAHGEDDRREVARGTNGSRLYLDARLSEGTRVLWEGEAWHLGSDTFTVLTPDMWATIGAVIMDKTPH
ncbi:hypothetical protein EYF80_017065 [Liparis tanakae]|uniref:Uncharacterized protein n=1 Tax=Liparis tanakae TaxID=230148 RepID=A0A4Z2I4S9_9TELE|nr:hypothetical protein EYF80_017065 [Liparis tanakae]